MNLQYHDKNIFTRLFDIFFSWSDLSFTEEESLEQIVSF